MSKIKRKLSVLFLLSFTTSSVYAEIKETTHMTEALANISAGDVVVFDIDNTILEPVQTLGTDQWYSYEVEKNKKQGMDNESAVDLAIEKFDRVARITKVKPVEAETPELIKNMQRNQVMVIALTARPREWDGMTIRQLNSIGVQFHNYGYEFQDYQSVSFHNGIIFVGPRNNKGKVLDQFFKTLNIKPNKLVFVDDRENHVKSMDAIFSNREIINTNFRYGGADAKVKSFSPEIAETQWKHFELHGELLTDDEALQNGQRNLGPQCAESPDLLPSDCDFN